MVRGKKTKLFLYSFFCFREICVRFATQKQCDEFEKSIARKSVKSKRVGKGAKRAHIVGDDLDLTLNLLKEKTDAEMRETTTTPTASSQKEV